MFSLELTSPAALLDTLRAVLEDATQRLLPANPLPLAPQPVPPERQTPPLYQERVTPRITHAHGNALRNLTLPPAPDTADPEAATEKAPSAPRGPLDLEFDVPRLPDVGLYSWPQVWGDGRCGFAGMDEWEDAEVAALPPHKQRQRSRLAAAYGHFTVAQTVVLLADGGDRALVYHAGRYAYTVQRPNAAFHAAMAAHQLPGATEAEAIKSLSKPWPSSGTI